MLKGSVSLRLAIGHTTVAVISEWFSIGTSDVRRCLLGAIICSRRSAMAFSGSPLATTKISRSGLSMILSVIGLLQRGPSATVRQGDQDEQGQVKRRLWQRPAKDEAGQ